MKHTLLVVNVALAAITLGWRWEASYANQPAPAPQKPFEAPPPSRRADVSVVKVLKDYAANPSLADADYINQPLVFHGTVGLKYSNSEGSGVVMGDPRTLKGDRHGAKGVMVFEATPEVIATLIEGEAVSVDCEIVGHKIAGAAFVMASRCGSWRTDDGAAGPSHPAPPLGHGLHLKE
jgi:hypothetical protein